MHTAFLRRGLVLAAVAALSAVTIPNAGAQAVLDCEPDERISLRRILECVTVEGVREHQAALQAIADANGGNRASGQPGHAASRDYIAGVLEAANFDVTIQEFQFDYFQELADPFLERVSPDPAPIEAGTMDFTPSGDVTAPLVAVDVTIPPTPEPSSTSGCEPEDFAGFPAGSIALIQRGTCFFSDKVANAAAAGAVGVIVFNEGQEGRTDILDGFTLGFPAAIPTVGISFADGEVLYTQTLAGEVVVHIVTSTLSESRPAWNVFGETPGGNKDNVVMAGAHYDSVQAGPGINDNGSGTGALLELAQHMNGYTPNNTVRFAFWGAEESGLIGSTHYVTTLPEEDLARIALYLNFDMVGSPNFVRFIYDGDGDAFGLAGPDGSDVIETLYEKWFRRQGLQTEPSEISFRSDYAAFFEAGIPFGGLFSGAEGIKTEAEAAIYGGTAGEQYDPCYHQACDTYENVSLEVLGQFTEAIVFSVFRMAMNSNPVTTDREALSTSASTAGPRSASTSDALWPQAA